MHTRHRPTSRALLVTVLLGFALIAGGALSPSALAAPDPAAMPGAAEVTVQDDLGTWSVEQAGVETWDVSWRSAERLPVTSDRPTIVTAEPTAAGPEPQVGVPTVADDGRTVQATVVSPDLPKPADLDVVLSGQTIDEPTERAPSAAAARWDEPARDLLPAQPAAAGALPVTSEDYRLPGIRLAGMPAKIEMVGHVVKPADRAASADHPLVMFLHGRHGYCYDPGSEQLAFEWPCRRGHAPVPSQRGYDYVQRTLASRGYVTVSIAANGINAQDGQLSDGGAAARSLLVRRHLALWATWAGHTERVDMDNVVLVGHSRGGEGVARASLETPLGADYRVAGQVLVAPTNFSRQTTPYVPTVTVLPYCDGDVSDLQGQAYTDVSRDLTTDDTAMKSSVMVVGANHNFFNTEWTPGTSAAPSEDDWSSDTGACAPGAQTRLSARDQRGVGRSYIAGAVRLFASGEEQFRPMYDGSAVRVGSTDAVVLSHMLGGGRQLRRPGPQARRTPPRHATTQLCRGLTGFGENSSLCGRITDDPGDTPHWPSTQPRVPSSRAFEMSWKDPGSVGGLSFETPLDLSRAVAMDLRTVVDPKIGDVTVAVRVTDQDGRTTRTAPHGGRALPALPTGPKWFSGKYWAQNVRVETADLTGIDLSRVTRVELVGLSGRGRVWVLDVAGTPDAVPAVPAKRIPIVDLGSVKVHEGGRGERVAEVPYTVTGSLSEAAHFRVFAMDLFGDVRRRIDVGVPPSSRGGSFGWEYEGNGRDSLSRIVHSLSGYAVRNVMLRDHQGRVVITDDDPPPQVAFGRLARSTTEGRKALWEATLSRPVDYEVAFTLRAVAGDDRTVPVRVNDVGRRWLERWVFVGSGTSPALHRADVGVFKVLRPGERSVRFGVPVRQDRRSEARESVTMVARASGLRWRSGPVTVFVRRGR